MDAAIAQGARNSTWNVNASVDYSVCEDEVLEAAEDSIPFFLAHIHTNIFSVYKHIQRFYALATGSTQQEQSRLGTERTWQDDDDDDRRGEGNIQTNRENVSVFPASLPPRKKSCDDTLTQSRRTHTNSQAQTRLSLCRVEDRRARLRGCCCPVASQRITLKGLDEMELFGVCLVDCFEIKLNRSFFKPVLLNIYSKFPYLSLVLNAE